MFHLLKGAIRLSPMRQPYGALFDGRECRQVLGLGF